MVPIQALRHRIILCIYNQVQTPAVMDRKSLFSLREREAVSGCEGGRAWEKVGEMRGGSQSEVVVPLPAGFRGPRNPAGRGIQGFST
jgi:hypothetical protein